MFCSKCGAGVTEGSAFCKACGAPVAGMGAAPPASVPQVYAPVAGVSPPHVAASPAPGVAYAGFWLRFVAALIDGILISIPLAPFLIGIFASAIPSLTRSSDPFELMMTLLPRLALFLVLYAVGSWLYWSLLESSSWRATLGKKALGLYVTDIAGSRVSFGRSSGRFFAGRFLWMVPSIGGLYCLVDCICAGVTEKKQAVHDMIASCLVLRKL